jgi:hypothetical protein
MASVPYLSVPPAYTFEVFSHGGNSPMPHAFVEYHTTANGYRLVVRGDNGTTSALNCTSPELLTFLEAFIDAMKAAA